MRPPGSEQTKTLPHSKSDTELVQHRDVTENSHEPQDTKEGEKKPENEVKTNGETTEKSQEVKQSFAYSLQS